MRFLVQTQRAMTLALSMTALLLLCGACPPAASGPASLPTVPKAARRARPQIRTFSELHPVTSLALLGKKVFIGSAAGLRVHDLGSGTGRAVAGPGGKPLGAVHAASAGKGGLWLVAAQGAGTASLLNRHRGAWKTVPAGGPVRPRTLLAAPQGVLVGGAGGLFLLRGGAWKRLLPGAKVSLLVNNLAGKGAWIGTDGEGLYSFVDGKLTPHSVDRGQPIRRVRALTHTAAGGVVALGADGRGRDLLAYFDGRQWTAYWPPAGIGIGFLAQVRGQVYFGVGKDVMRLVRAPKGKRPVSMVDLSGERAPTAPADYPIPYFYAAVADHALPAAPTVVVDGGEQLLMGTARQGVALFDGKNVRWIRGSSFTRLERRLRVACADAKGCFVAFGGQGYFGDGRGFRRVYPDADANARVQGFIANRRGQLFSLHSPGATPTTLVVSELTAAGFVPKARVEVKVPHGGVQVHFLRIGPQGRIWAGASYVDGQKEERPWGIVVIGLDGKALFHRSSTLPEEDRPSGSLALPDDLRDVSFLQGDLWLATGSGICHVIGKTQKIVQITENEGLASELVYGIARDPEGRLLVGTFGGLGRYDGKYWHFDFPAPLTSAARTMVPARGGIMVATAKGLVTLRRGGKKPNVEVLAAKGGLAHDEVYDLFQAKSGELWVLTKGGLSIVGGPKRAPAPWGAPAVRRPTPPAPAVAPTPAPTKTAPQATKKAAGVTKTVSKKASSKKASSKKASSKKASSKKASSKKASSKKASSKKAKRAKGKTR